MSKFDPQEAQIDQIAQMLEEAIRENRAPWRREWDIKSSIAHNPYTGTIYSGFNPVLLALLSHLKGYETNAWLTFNNVKDLGGRIKKGARAFPVTFFGIRKPTEEEVQKHIQTRQKWGVILTPQEVMEDKTLEKPYTRTFSVFNLDDTEIDLEVLRQHQKQKGIQELLEKKFDEKSKEFTPIESVEEIIKNSEIRFETNNQGRAFYSPIQDIISMPPKYTFENELGYYATALHELGHATGHTSRLNRKKLIGSEEEYAQEELRAEIFSFMQGERLGLSFDFQNHIAYLQSYQKISKEGIKEAVRDVFKMNQYVAKHWYPKALRLHSNELSIEQKPQIEQIAQSNRVSKTKTSRRR